MPGSSGAAPLLAQAVPSALLGELILFGIFAMVVWAFLKEAARIIVRVGLVVALGVAVAVWAGWLDQTMAQRFFAWVGDGLMTGLQAVTRWLIAAWQGIVGGE